MSEQTVIRHVKMKKWQIITILIGVLIFIVGIFAYQLGLSASRGFSSGKAALLFGGFGLVIVGVLGRKTVEAYKATAIMLLNTLVLLVIIEFGFVIIARIGDFFPKSWQESQDATKRDLRYVDDGREDLPYYHAQDWGKDYWREYHAAWDERERAYAPYLGWRSKPFKGKTININENGLRVTPGADCGPDSYKVFAFGGSTMWGTGVPDWGTIPAFLQSGLMEAGIQPVCVINYAEQGYSSTQGVIQLMLALQVGDVPDVVVFYDGINDVFSAYQGGVPGIHQNLSEVTARFEKREEVSPLVTLLSKTRTYKFLAKLVLGEGYDKPKAPYKAKGIKTDILANGVAQVYLGNYEIVNSLAREYGFKALFFWQGMLLVEEKPLTEEEQSIKVVADDVYPGLAMLYRMTSQQIEEAARQRSNLYSLVNLFDGHTELVYIDPFHVTVEGNRLVATEMLRILRRLSH